MRHVLVSACWDVPEEAWHSEALKQDKEDQMSGKLEGKIALVTGGTAGIGLATAQRFVKEGAYVFVSGRRQTELDLAANLNCDAITAIHGDFHNERSAARRA